MDKKYGSAIFCLSTYFKTTELELQCSNPDGSFTTAVSTSFFFFFDSLGKNPIAADLGQFRAIFCFDIGNGILCVL